MTEPEAPARLGEPQRTCIGCRAKRGQSEMARLGLGLSENGAAVKWDTGRQLGGRGAWLCRGRETCLAAALKKKAFGRAFKTSIALDTSRLEEDFRKIFGALK